MSILSYIVTLLGGLQPGSSCETLVLECTERWEPMPPMHQARGCFTAAAVGGCVIVAGGHGASLGPDLPHLRHGLTLVHFSAQHESFSSLKPTATT